MKLTINRISFVVIVLAVGFQGLTSILRHRRESNANLEGRSPTRDAPPATEMDVTALPSSGNGAAKLVLIEFSDYECPFCARYANDVFPSIKEHFIGTGKLKYVFANNPLSFHSNASSLATGAICAGQQGKYWEMHEAIFKEKPRKSEDVTRLVRRLGLNEAAFDSCVKDGNAATRIEADAKKAAELRLTGTPSFALGRMNPGGRVTLLKFIVGAQPVDLFKSTIAGLLRDEGL